MAFIIKPASGQFDESFLGDLEVVDEIDDVHGFPADVGEGGTPFKSVFFAYIVYQSVIIRMIHQFMDGADVLATNVGCIFRWS